MEENTRENKMGTMPIGKLLANMAGPVMISMLFQALYNIVDSVFVARLSQDAMNAVSLAFPLQTLCIAFAVGTGVGMNALLARSLGEKNMQAVDRAAGTGLFLTLCTAAVFAVLGFSLATPFFRFQTENAQIIAYGSDYVMICIGGSLGLFLQIYGERLLQSTGRTDLSMISQIAGAVCNIVLDPLFIFVFDLGVQGAAIATVLSNAVSAAILWVFLLKTDKVIRLEPKKLRIDGLCLKQILRIGVPAGVQSAMFSIANIVIQGAINSLGTVVMAASSAAYNIEVITYDILNSFSQACTTFVGQNFGAGEIKRCKKTLLLCLLEGIISLGVAIALILFFGKSLLTIFNGDPQVVETGYIRLMLIMPSHLFSLCYEVLSGYLRGFEISLPPAVLTMLGVCGVRLSWLRWVFPQYKTFMNIMLVFPISLATTALLMLAAVLYFRPSRRYAHLQKSDGAASAKIEG